MTSYPLIAAALLPVFLVSQPGADRAPAADDAWPEYRGAGQDGHATHSRPPLRWGEERNVAWKTAIHGRGWSSPVVLENRVWLTTATEDGKELSVLAVAADSGEILIDRVLIEIEEPQTRNALNSFASPSPVLEQGRAYVHFGYAGTAALDSTSGATLWMRNDILCDHMEGPGSSPVLFEDLLIFNVDGGDVQFVIALDKNTGETRWRTERTLDLADLENDRRKAFSTPLVLEVDGRTELISSAAEGTVAYDPLTGKELWVVHHNGFSMSSRPVAGAGLVFINTGFMSPRLHAVRPGGDGDVSETHVSWSTANGVPSMPTPVFFDGLLTMVSDRGIVTCLDALSGDVVWKERIGGEFCASPILAGEHIYLFDREGKATILRAGPEPEVIAVNELDEGCMASPAPLDKALIVRTTTHLLRIQETH